MYRVPYPELMQIRKVFNHTKNSEFQVGEEQYNVFQRNRGMEVLWGKVK